jgi:antirestriction protein
MTNQYHATPYDLSATGFYFSTFEEYTEQAAKHCNEYGDPVEEYEIQFIEGDNYKLFDALGINQANLKRWFDEFEDMDEDELIKGIYLADDQGCDMDQVLSQLEDVVLFEGSAEEYAENYIEETGLLDQMPESLRYYFDTKAFARDMLLNGDITELTIEGTTYIAWGC